jgi:replicative DNA helicase
MSGEVIPFRETEAAETRVLPHNLEAEAALLGALLSENHLFDFVADVLAPADFYEPLHQRIYETAQFEVMAGRTATPVTLRGRFIDDADMTAVGGPTYLAQLTADGQGLLAPGDLARHIRDLSRRRAIATKLDEAMAACLNENVALSSVADLVTGAVAEGPDDGLIELSAGACVENHLRNISEGTAGITCGRIPSFDRVVGPLRPKHLVLLAARPGMGKTSVAMSYSIGAARSGFGVLFVSLEMSGDELGGRAAADMCFGLDGEGGVPYGAIAAGDLNQWQRERVGKAAYELDQMPLTIIDVPSITPGRLARLVRRHVRRFEARGTPLKLVVVDYLQRMRPDRQMQKKYEEVSEISAALKDIAKSNDVAIMALAQLNREVEKRGDKRPMTADLRDSGQLEQDADTIVFLLRQEYYHRLIEPDSNAPEWPGWNDALHNMSGEIEFIVPKRRGGETGSAKGAFYGAYQAVRG